MYQGQVRDDGIHSQALGRTQCVRVIVPPDYEPRARDPYPVLYFLHPWGLSPRYITGKLNMAQHVWAGIAQGTLPRMVVVLPAGDKSFFINPADPPGHDWTGVLQMNETFFHDALDLYGCYGDYLLQEVIPHIEASYHVRTDRAGRVIGGISMGGAAAAVHAFRNPARFSAVGIHSPALFAGPPEDGGPPWIFGLDRDSFAARNPADLVRNVPPENQPRVWLDTGERDVMRNQVEHLHQALGNQGIAHEYHTRPGGHDKSYWEPMMPRYLAFYAQDWV